MKHILHVFGNFQKKWHKHSKFFGFSIASVEQGCKYRCITVKCLALNCAMHNVHSIPATKCWEVIVRVWHHAAADVGDGNESFAFRVCLQRARLPQREAFFIPLLGGGGLRGGSLLRDKTHTTTQADFFHCHQGQSARWGEITYFHFPFSSFLKPKLTSPMLNNIILVDIGGW